MDHAHGTEDGNDTCDALRTRSIDGIPDIDAFLATGVFSSDDSTTAGMQTGSTIGLRVAAEPPLLTTPLAPSLNEPDADGQRYRVDGLLGRGAGGQVFAIFDHHLQRSVALKVMHRKHIGNARAGGNLIREARIAAELEHPNILPIYDLDEDSDGRLRFAMRKTVGRSLDQLLIDAESGEVPSAIETLANRVEIMLKVCDAIAYAHDKGVVHQDIKPANIMVGDFGEVLVVDWGMAIYDSMPGQLAGTPMYMSPEQARREGSDQRSDIYCLGATLYHLLSFQLPVVEPDVERFWHKKRHGHVDPFDLETMRRLPLFLRDVIAMAMAPDPDQRYQRCVDLAADLKQYLSNERSIAISLEAATTLAGLADHPDHRAYGAVEGAFRQALDLWPANRSAQEGLSEALASHARFALAAGDIALAESLIDGNDLAHAPLAREIAASRGRRQRLLRRGRTVGLAAALAIIAVVVVIVQQVRDHYHRVGRWVPVIDLDLAADPAAFDRIEVTKQIVDRVLEPQQVPGAGCSLQFGETLWLRDVREPGDVRVHIEATWTDGVDGIDMMLHAERTTMATAYQAPPSYVGQVGGWANLLHFIKTSRGGVEGRAVDRLARSELESGRRYRFTYQLEGSTTTLSIDGEEILRYREPLPVASSRHTHVAIRCWAPTTIHRVTVERLSLPLKSSPLAVADGLFSYGHYHDAYDHYRQLADDYPGSAIEERALARAVMLGWFEPDLRGDQERLYARLQEAYPTSPLLADCLALLAQQWADSDQLDRALAAIPTILADQPQSRIAERILRLRPPSMQHHQRDRLIGFLHQTDNLLWLDIRNLDLADLESIRGLDLLMLFAQHNDISDLEPLRGMPLERLFLDHNQISDLSPLAGMELYQLSITGNTISDLSPLAGQPLVILGISDNQVGSLAPLADSRIVHLLANRNRISDLAPLADQPLQNVHLEGNAISDLQPLAGMGLYGVMVAGNPITDLGPIADSAYLQRLDCHDTLVGELPDLATRGLQTIDLRGTGVTRMATLGGQDLRSVRLAATSPDDLSVLAGQPVMFLDCRGCGLTSWTATVGAPTAFILLSGNPIPPGTLTAVGAQQTVELLDMPWTAADWQVLQAAWSDRPLLARQAAIFAAIAADDAGALRALAEPWAGQRVLRLPIQVDQERARNLAARFAARLPRPRDDRAVQSLMTGPWTFSTWLDVEPSVRGLHWSDGTLITGLTLPRQASDVRHARGLIAKQLGSEAAVNIAYQADEEAGVILVWDDDQP